MSSLFRCFRACSEAETMAEGGGKQWRVSEGQSKGELASPGPDQGVLCPP